MTRFDPRPFDVVVTVPRGGYVDTIAVQSVRRVVAGDVAALDGVVSINGSIHPSDVATILRGRKVVWTRGES